MFLHWRASNSRFSRGLISEIQRLVPRLLVRLGRSDERGPLGIQPLCELRWKYATRGVGERTIDPRASRSKAAHRRRATGVFCLLLGCVIEWAARSSAMGVEFAGNLIGGTRRGCRCRRSYMTKSAIGESSKSKVILKRHTRHDLWRVFRGLADMRLRAILVYAIESLFASLRT